MNLSGEGNQPDPLTTARTVLRGVKHRLPADEFEIQETTLFVPSESMIPRAAFAVVFTGVPLGMVAVQFEVPDDIDTMADALVAGLLERRQRSWEENGHASGSMSLVDLTPGLP